MIYIHRLGTRSETMLAGTYTAMVTPFRRDGSVDNEGMEMLVRYQIENGIDGLLVAGTTGETPALSHEEYVKLLPAFRNICNGHVGTMASCGKNNFDEALEASKLASELGYGSILLVEPYYNGPSSMEIRKEYVEPIADAVPGTNLVPYVIPGRTGTHLLPQDLAVLHDEYAQVDTVKEATGDIENMKLTRKLCGKGYSIMSGDDSLTHRIMTDGEISANGVISVMSNIFPRHVSEMVGAIRSGDGEKAVSLSRKLSPWFDLVTVKTIHQGRYGQTPLRFRNPLPVKTIMSLFGMPSGGCRRPLGRMTRAGLMKIVETARRTIEQNPELLEPVEDAFDVDIERRLENGDILEGLCYEEN